MNAGISSDNHSPDKGFREIAAILARGYLRLREKQAAECQRVNQRGAENGLEVPGERSVHGPAVNAAGDANHSSPPRRTGGRK